MHSISIELEGSAGDLNALKPIWLSTEQQINNIPKGKLLLSTQGNSLATSQYDADIARCRPGTKIKVFIEQNTKKDVIFSGVIVEQALMMRRSRVELTLCLKHNLAALESSCRSQVFNEISAAAIISRLLSEQNISCTNTAKMNGKLEQEVQFCCSDWLYVRQLLNDYGAWLLPNFETIKIIQPAVSKQADHTLSNNVLVSGSASSESDPVIEANWQFNDQYQPAELKFTAWDITQQKNISVKAVSESLGQQALNPAKERPLNDTPWVIGSSISLMQNELESLANSTLQNLQEAGVQGRFKLNGAINYQLGQTLALSGFGKGFDGLGLITGVSHDASNSEWTTVISLGTNAKNITMPPRSRVSGLQIGIVSTFKKDPLALDRVQVSLPVLGDTSNVLWARLGMPYASKESGFCFFPEAGDEVVLGFFEEDPCYPLILGAMYNPKNKAPISMSKGNQLKGIMFGRDGEKVSLQFDSSSSSTLLSTKDFEIKLKDDIVIKSKSSKGGVEIKAKKINLIN